MYLLKSHFFLRDYYTQVTCKLSEKQWYHNIPPSSLSIIFEPIRAIQPNFGENVAAINKIPRSPPRTMHQLRRFEDTE
jgi:hypothetical protein